MNTEIKCSYCNSIAYMPQYIQPAICEKHLNIVMVITQLEREKRMVTVRNVQTELERYFNTQIEYSELRMLLGQLGRKVGGNAYFLVSGEFMHDFHANDFYFPKSVVVTDIRPSGDALDIFRVEIYCPDLPEEETGPYQVMPIYGARIAGSHTEPVFISFEILVSGVRINVLEA